MTERDDSSTLVEEDGLLVGFSGALANRAGGWQFGIEGDLLRASLDYDGATQSGSPLDSDTSWEHRRGGVFVERRIYWPVPIDLGGRLDYQQRHRDISSTQDAAGLEEDYETIWLGFRGSMTPWRSSLLQIDVGCAVHSRVDVRFRSELDDASLGLDDHCRASIAAGMDLGRVGSGTFYLRPFAAWERYPRSDSEQLTSGGLPVGQVHLPETEFLTFGVTIGVRRSLDAGG